MIRKKVVALLLVTVFATVFVAGCGKNDSKTSDGKVVRWGASEPDTLDPRKMTADVDYVIGGQLFEGLTLMDEKAQCNPAAAEKWEVSPDGLVWKFFLRSDAKWSNGDPVTAQDFEYAWKTALSPELASEYAFQLYYIKNGENYNKGKCKADDVGVKALDDKTLLVTLERPCAYFLSLTSTWTYYPVHKKTVEANPKWAAAPESIICNGPFVLTVWKHNGSMEMVKNSQYWDAGNVTLNKLEVVLLDNGTTASSMLDSGQIDITNLMNMNDIPRLQQAGKLRQYPSLGTYYLPFNTKKAPFDNPKVRKAFMLAIDRDAICKTILKAGQIPALGWVPYGMPDAKPGEEFRKVGGEYYKDNDIETAKKLLAEAGYPAGRGLPPITYLYNTGEAHKAIAEAIQEMWKKNLGVDIKLANQEWKVYLNSMRQLDFQVCRYGWFADYVDPMTFIDVFQSDNGNNYTGWKNEKYDDLVNQAKKTNDQVVRMKLMHEAENMLMDEAVMVPLYQYRGTWAVKPNLKGFVRTPLATIQFKGAYFE